MNKIEYLKCEECGKPTRENKLKMFFTPEGSMLFCEKCLAKSKIHELTQEEMDRIGIQV
jgi:hypothetical protein